MLRPPRDLTGNGLLGQICKNACSLSEGWNKIPEITEEPY